MRLRLTSLTVVDSRMAVGLDWVVATGDAVPLGSTPRLTLGK